MKQTIVAGGWVLICLLAGSTAGALRQANTWTISTTGFIGPMSWNAKGDIFTPRNEAGILSFAMKRAGFVHQRGPVAGSAYNHCRRNDAFVVIFEASGSGSILRLFNKNLKELGTATITGTPNVRGRACMGTSGGGGTLTYTVQRW